MSIARTGEQARRKAGPLGKAIQQDVAGASRIAFCAHVVVRSRRTSSEGAYQAALIVPHSGQRSGVARRS